MKLRQRELVTMLLGEVDRQYPGAIVSQEQMNVLIEAANYIVDTFDDVSTAEDVEGE